LFRIGLILPSSNTTMEPEFSKMLVAYSSMHSSRLRLQNVTVSELEVMERETERAAHELQDANVDLLCYGCTSGSLFKGLGHDQALVQRIRNETGIPTIATSGAVVEALHHIHARRITVATPYIKEIDDLEESFLAANGFEVMKIIGLGLTRNLDIGLQEPQVVYNLAKKAYLTDADAIFISCTNLRTIEIIKRLEDELEKPVVSSNTATAWKALRVLGVKDEKRGYGQLLADT
jgi:maleate isomerase